MQLKACSLSHSLLLAGALAGLALAATPSQAQNDPPPGDSRVANLRGNVSIQPYGVDDWGQAVSNQPIGPGDRVSTDPSGRGELQAGPIRAYFSPNVDITLLKDDWNGVELGIAQGTAHVISDGFDPGHGFSMQTPSGAITVATRTDFRVDVYPDQQSEIITNYSTGDIALNGAGGFYMHLAHGESIQLTGTNPVYAQPLEPAPQDEFGGWSANLESRRMNSISARYVSEQMAGYDELDSAGDWQPQSDYGPIWFPRVEVGWAPYHYGHWINQPYYGWTWVADEPWGAAPFHYGRWVQIDGRWGWIPGARDVRPVWSPAQVVFAGGVQFGGGAVSVWFPLGPGEAYKPWYPCSPQYINQVNITNIHESRVVHVQNTYINVVNITNVTYINRTVGVTAMKQEDFAAGRSTKNVAVIKVDPHQLDHIQAARPEAKPPAKPVILRPVAKPSSVPEARPVLINAKGEQASAAPNAKPVAVPVKAAPPAPKPIPGHAAIGTPTVGGKPVAAPAKAVPPPTPAKPETMKPEAAKPEPMKPEPSKAEPAKPEPAKPAPPQVKPVPVKPETIKPETIKPETMKPVAPEPKPAVEPVKPNVPAAKPDPKDNKKPQDKKDDKKKEEKKPD